MAARTVVTWQPSFETISGESCSATPAERPGSARRRDAGDERLAAALKIPTAGSVRRKPSATCSVKPTKERPCGRCRTGPPGNGGAWPARLKTMHGVWKMREMADSWKCGQADDRGLPPAFSLSVLGKGEPHLPLRRKLSVWASPQWRSRSDRRVVGRRPV